MEMTALDLMYSFFPPWLRRYAASAPTTSADRVCADVSTCQASVTYEVQAPTLTSDRVRPLMTQHLVFPSDILFFIVVVSVPRYTIPSKFRSM